MFENVTLDELTDAELQDVLDNSGKGKAPIYKRPIRDAIAFFDGRQGSISVPYLDINPDAKTRQNVILGMRNALKAMKETRLIVRANTDDTKVTLYFKASA